MAKEDIEKKSNEECPQCHKERLVRQSTGVWECRSCGNKVAGGAFEADTGAVDKIEKAIRETTEELEEIKDKV